MYHPLLQRVNTSWNVLMRQRSVVVDINYFISGNHSTGRCRRRRPTLRTGGACRRGGPNRGCSARRVFKGRGGRCMCMTTLSSLIMHLHSCLQYPDRKTFACFAGALKTATKSFFIYPSQAIFRKPAVSEISRLHLVASSIAVSPGAKSLHREPPYLHFHSPSRHQIPDVFGEGLLPRIPVWIRP